MKAKLLLETMDAVEQVYNEYLNNPKFRMDIIKTALSNGYVVHGTDAEFSEFDKDYVKGGLSANYGYGFYFTDNVTKFTEYGSDPSKYKFCDISDMTFLKLSDTPNKVGFESRAELTDYYQTQMFKAERYLESATSNKEYTYYSDMVDELNAKIDELKHGVSRADEYIDNFISKNKDLDFESINKRIASSSVRDLQKEISMYYAKLGYDGFIGGYEYVIFNYDKLNNKLVKDLKTFVYKMSRSI